MTTYIYRAIDYDDGLRHYGVPGMKWGVRNAETQAKYAGGKQRRHGNKVGATSSKTNKKVDAYKTYGNYRDDYHKAIEKSVKKDAAYKKALSEVKKYERKNKIDFTDPDFDWSNFSKDISKEWSKKAKTTSKARTKATKHAKKTIGKEITDKYIQKYGKQTLRKGSAIAKAKTSVAVAAIGGLSLLAAPIAFPLYMAIGMARNRPKTEESEKE